MKFSVMCHSELANKDETLMQLTYILYNCIFEKGEKIPIDKWFYVSYYVYSSRDSFNKLHFEIAVF